VISCSIAMIPRLDEVIPLPEAGPRRRMLDTNIASHIIRGPSPDVRVRLAPAPGVCISAITEGEILFGLAKKPEAVNLRKGAETFLLRVEVLPWTSEAARAYGRLRVRLEGEGTPLGSLDTLIAAHAMAENAILVTRDKSLARTPGLTVEDWLAS